MPTPRLAQARFGPTLAQLEADAGRTPAGLALEARADVSGVLVRGGMTVGATLSGRAFVELGDLDPPLRVARLVGVGPVAHRLPGCAHLAALESLSLAGCRLADAELGPLLASPYLAGLRRLDLGGNRLTAAIGGLARLSSLGLAEQLHDLTALDELLQSLTRLTTLDASGSRLGDALPRRLVGAGLRSLELADCGLTPDAELPAGLVRLELGFNALGDDGVVRLAESGAFAACVELGLAGNRLSGRGLAAVLERAPKLERLEVRANPRLGAAEWAACGAVPGGLRRMELTAGC